jgi:hypothetical protein
MHIQTIKQTYDLLSLVGKDTTLHKTGSYHVGPCPFCGGRDRFTLKQTLNGYRWYCRKCGGEKYYSVFDYLMRRDRITFSEALERLGCERIPPPKDGVQEDGMRRLLYDPPSKDWQDKGFSFTLSASNMLLNSPEAEPARAYLRNRGIQEWLWQKALLGFSWAYDPILRKMRPAVGIPHLDRPMNLMAVKFRFVDESADGLRYTSMKGSRPLFFGLDSLLPRHETLLMVEGEINLLSIFQVIWNHLSADPRISVLSPGCETPTKAQKAILPILVQGYKRVIVWTDKGEKALEMEKASGRPCDKLQSPYGQDANDLLRAGVLPEFLGEIGVRLF